MIELREPFYTPNDDRPTDRPTDRWTTCLLLALIVTTARHMRLSTTVLRSRAVEEATSNRRGRTRFPSKAVAKISRNDDARALRDRITAPRLLRDTRGSGVAVRDTARRCTVFVACQARDDGERHSYETKNGWLLLPA